MQSSERHRHLALGLFASLASWGLYFSLLWPKMFFERDGELWAGSRTVWSDWAAHFAYANVFASRPPSEWFGTHPLFASETFNYPFLSDGLSGLLMRAGVGPVEAFVLPSIVASLALVALLYLFYARVLGSARQALLAQTLFFTSGGLGFLLYLKDVARDGFSTVPPREYSHLPEQGIYWFNVVAAELLPQRAMLFGLPVALAILIPLCRQHRSDAEGASLARNSGLAALSRRNTIGLGIATGVLLVTHVHSYLALVLICALLMLGDLQSLRRWLLFGISAALASAIVFSLTYGTGTGHGFLAWQPGWLAPASGRSTGLFLWLNWGVFLPLALVSMLRQRSSRDPLALAGLLLFVACFVIRFQPHAWDNTKLLTWAHLLLCIPVARYLDALWSRPQPLARGLALLLLCFASATGGLELWRLTQPELAMRMWSAEEVELSASFREQSRPMARVASAGDPHDWTTSLAGRPSLLGYPGWLWTYGFDYAPVQRDLHEILSGGPASEALMRQHAVEFVVIGPRERHSYDADEAYFLAHHQLVLSSENYRVFSIEEGTDG